MNKCRLIACLMIVLFACVLVSHTAAQAAGPAPAAPAATSDTAGIDQLREGLAEAFSKKDVDKMLTYLHPDVVVTWQNGEVSKGRDGVKAYYNRMMVGNDAVCDSVSAHPVVEGRNVNGDT